MSEKIVIIGADDYLESVGKKMGYEVQVVDELKLSHLDKRTLILKAGSQISWDLVPNGFEFIKRWDLAAPMGEYGSLAYDLGDSDDRKLTSGVTGDLRIFPYHTGMIFVGPGGIETIKLWLQEPGDRQLAFLRAVFALKPRVCVLPIHWVRKLAFNSSQFVTNSKTKHKKKFQPLVKVEIRPGEFVKVHPEDIDKVFEQTREAKMPVVKSSESWPRVTAHLNRGKGPLVKIEIKPGQAVKMYRRDAIEQGFLDEVWEGEQTEVQPNNDGDNDPPVVQDDFTEINGVGPATAKLILNRGILTFEQLKAADVSFLSPKAAEAVDDWKASNDTDE